MTILGSDGSPKYIVENNKVTDVQQEQLACEHVILIWKRDEKLYRCYQCGKTLTSKEI